MKNTDIAINMNNNASPQKRKIQDLKQLSPNKHTVTRRPVLVEVAEVADDTIVILRARIAGNNTKESFTNPARMEIVGDNRSTGTLMNEGFFMVGTRTEADDSDLPLRTPRRYVLKNLEMLL